MTGEIALAVAWLVLRLVAFFVATVGLSLAVRWVMWKIAGSRGHWWDD